MAHRDGYTAFVTSGLGKTLAASLGLPQPVGAAPVRARPPARRRPGARRWPRRRPGRWRALRDGSTGAGATLVDEVPDGEPARRRSSSTSPPPQDPADLESLRATRRPRP